MSQAADDQRRRKVGDYFHSEVTAWVVLAVSLVITYFGWFIAEDYVNRRATERFAFEVDDARDRISKRMRDYEEVLRGGVALFYTNDLAVSRTDWYRYTDTLELQHHFPGIQGLGFARMLQPDEVAANEAEVRAEGFPTYTVHPAGKRAQYSAIMYLEPFDWRNQRAFGYDMFSEKVRRAAMEQARDSGHPAVSGRVTLVQETEQDVQPGFLMYLPLYRPGLPTQTVAQRRAALYGFIYSPFRIKDLMRGILGSSNPDLGFEIYDGSGAMDTTTLLYETPGFGAADEPPRQQMNAQVLLPGHTWTVHFHSQPRFDRAMDTSQPEVIAFGGLLVDIMLFVIIWSLAGERRRVQRKAEAITAELHTSNQRLQLAQASAAIGIWDLDLRDNTLVWDQRMHEIYGLSTAAFAGDRGAWRGQVDPRDIERVETEVADTIRAGCELNTSFRITRADGAERVIEAHAKLVHDEQGQPLRLVGVNIDITERALVEQRLRLAASVFDNAHEGIAITDAGQRIIDVNPTFTEVTGYRRDEAIGKTPRMLRSGFHDAEFYQAMWHAIEKRSFWRGEIRNRRKNGEVFTELLTVSAVRGPNDEVTHYVGVFSDITELKEHQHRLEHMAHFDPLTQLPNRVLLADRLHQAMAVAKRSEQLLAVCYLDLDGFKPVNDQYGHEVGDQLLIEVADRLKSHMRESDSAARLGGDEFVLLLTNLASAAECERALQRLLSSMSSTYHVGAGHEVRISASIGVTLYPLDEADTDTLLRHADQAMYQAKQSGRNRYFLFDPEDERQTRAEQEAIQRFEQAIDNNELRLHYQPTVDMRRGTVVALEALIRWHHPEAGLLYPASFLPLADNNGLASRLGEWVIAQALAQMATWQAEGLDLKVSVNIGGRHLQQRGFAAHLAEALARYPQVPAGRLELEVLETTALEDIEVVSRVIEQCHHLGVSFALDDFGTGYSSLTYLKRLPASTLKIDQSFVHDILSDQEDMAIVEGIIGLTQAFRRQVVAEGVESIEHGVLLLKLGCDLAQGFGIARPMPAEEVLPWVRAYHQPEAWKSAGGVYWLREDLPLLGAELDHQRWVDNLLACLNGDSIADCASQLDSRHCRFGHWYGGHGQLRYHDLPAYRALGPAHERIHALAHELVGLKSRGETAELQARIDDLLRLREEMGKRLRDLQAAVTRSS